MTLADVFGRFAPEYLAKHHENILPSHVTAINAILKCRTDTLGGQVWFCKDCQEHHYSYHSCKNRHCPQCGNDKADEWLEKQQDLLLPAAYFMATFTVPSELHQIIRSNQNQMYNILFRTSAQALLVLAQDKRFVGGIIGLIGVLQTWTRVFHYHPHLHYLIPGGGLTADHRKWRRVKDHFLMHVKPLSRMFRNNFQEAMIKAGLYDQIPASVWNQEWVVNIIPVGNGESALKYLAPYIFRIALSNRNIISMDDETVTFRYRESGSTVYNYRRVKAMEFMRRFLQHVLPKGFIKVRYYGLFSSGKKILLEIVKKLLGVMLSGDRKSGKIKRSGQMLCPVCHSAMFYMNELKPSRGPPKLNLAITA